MRQFVTARAGGVFICVVFLVVGLTNVGVGQQPLTISVTHTPVDQLSIGDIDFQAGGNRNWYFTASVQSDQPRDVRLEMRAHVELSDQSFPDAIRFRSVPFSVPRTFTNLDIGSSSSIQIDGNVEYTPEARDRLLNEALATGRVPAGEYLFTFTVTDEGNPSISENATLDITIRNISRLDLVLPLNNQEVEGPFPLFQWIFDGSRVELGVYGFDPQRHRSTEDATDGTPYLVQVLEGVSSFQYSGGRPLAPGIYVWRLRGFTSGSGGVGNVINSEIWKFTVPAGVASGASPLGGGGSGTQQQTLLSQLQTIPGISPQILSQLAGGGLRLTGFVLSNGVSVPLSQILAILNDLAQNPDKIIDVQVVDRNQ